MNTKNLRCSREEKFAVRTEKEWRRVIAAWVAHMLTGLGSVDAGTLVGETVSRLERAARKYEIVLPEETRRRNGYSPQALAVRKENALRELKEWRRLLPTMTRKEAAAKLESSVGRYLYLLEYYGRK